MRAQAQETTGFLEMLSILSMVTVGTHFTNIQFFITTLTKISVLLLPCNYIYSVMFSYLKKRQRALPRTGSLPERLQHQA